MTTKNGAWAPFNSVMNGQNVLNHLTEEKNKVAKPILSDDQKIELENKIIEYYEQKDEITINYYESGYIKKLIGIITKIDPIKRKIYINNNLSLYFSNIVDIFAN